MTNADVIRKMTNKELVDFIDKCALTRMSDFIDFCILPCSKSKDCSICKLIWLELDAENNPKGLKYKERK